MHSFRHGTLLSLVYFCKCNVWKLLWVVLQERGDLTDAGRSCGMKFSTMNRCCCVSGTGYIVPLILYRWEFLGYSQSASQVTVVEPILGMQATTSGLFTWIPGSDSSHQACGRHCWAFLLLPIPILSQKGVFGKRDILVRGNLICALSDFSIF